MAANALRGLKQRLRILLKDADTIRALITDPVLSRTYYPECARKSKLAILAELILWWLRYGEANKYYYLYGLDRVGVDRDAVMPYRLFRAMRNSTNLRPSGLSDYYGTSYNFVCVLRDKYLFSRIATSLGFPVSEALAICSPDSVFWIRTGKRTPLEDLTSDASLTIDGIAKPVDGIMGSNIFPLTIDGGRLYIDGAEVSVDELRRRFSRRHLLEMRLTQHPDLARLHPRSINSLRLVTFNRNGSVVLFSASSRIGTGDRPTDNWSAGGILVSVDPESGRMRGDGYMKPSFGRRVSRHPDTGVVFDGFAVPEYDRAVALVQRFHAYLPGIHSIGWDVAITPEGPVVIEGNDDWDGAVPMVVEPGFRQKFMEMF